MTDDHDIHTRETLNMAVAEDVTPTIRMLPIAEVRDSGCECPGERRRCVHGESCTCCDSCAACCESEAV